MANGPILDLSTGEVTIGEQPDPIVPTPTEKWVAGDVFLARLTDDEYAAIMTYAASNVPLARLIDNLRLVGRIDVMDAKAAAAKSIVVDANILSADRANTIFS